MLFVLSFLLAYVYYALLTSFVTYAILTFITAAQHLIQFLEMGYEFFFRVSDHCHPCTTTGVIRPRDLDPPHPFSILEKPEYRTRVQVSGSAVRLRAEGYTEIMTELVFHVMYQEATLSRVFEIQPVSQPLSHRNLLAITSSEDLPSQSTGSVTTLLARMGPTERRRKPLRKRLGRLLRRCLCIGCCTKQ